MCTCVYALAGQCSLAGCHTINRAPTENGQVGKARDGRTAQAPGQGASEKISFTSSKAVTCVSIRMSQ